MPLRYFGTIVKTKGYEGKVLVTGLPAGAPDLAPGLEVKVGYSSQFSSDMTIAGFKRSRNGAEITFEGITSNDQAKLLREKGIFYYDELVEEKKDTYVVGELIGTTVVDIDTGEEVGTVIDVWILPANDVWVVDTGKGELPLPVTDDVVINVDMDKRIIEVKMIPGLWGLAKGMDDEEDLAKN